MTVAWNGRPPKDHADAPAHILALGRDEFVAEWAPELGAWTWAEEFATARQMTERGIYYVCALLRSDGGTSLGTREL